MSGEILELIFEIYPQSEQIIVFASDEKVLDTTLPDFLSQWVSSHKSLCVGVIGHSTVNDKFAANYDYLHVFTASDILNQNVKLDIEHLQKQFEVDELSGVSTNYEVTSTVGLSDFTIEKNEEGLLISYIGDLEKQVSGTFWVVHDAFSKPLEIQVTYLGPVSATEYETMLYPNPVKNEISLPRQFSGEYKILDMKGLIVAQGRMTPSQKISVKQLSPGMYVLKVAERTFRFIKK